MQSNGKVKHSTATTLIANNADIKGDIDFSGDLRVEGNISGNITSKVNAKATITISDLGHVQGEIKAPRVVINGRVEGDVYATEHLELAKKAEVTGNVYYAKMEMVMGATVNGKLLRQADFGSKSADSSVQNEKKSNKNNDVNEEVVAP